MARGNEPTTKFKADTSDFKKGIQDAVRQIRLANAEFKATTSGMDDWSKSTEGVQAKITQLEKTLENENKKLEAYKQQLAEVVKEQGENSKGADELRIKIANQEAAVNKTEKDLKKYQERLKSVDSEQEKTAESAEEEKSAYDKLKTSISNQEKALENLKKDYASVILSEGENSEAAQTLRSEMQELNSELNSNREKLKEAEDAANELTPALEDAADESNNTTEGFSIMKGALANLVSDGIRKGIDALKEFVKQTVNVGKSFDTSMSKVEAVSGAAGEEVDRLRDKAKEMGSTTKFTATEAADAFNYMAMAGWKTEDMLDGIDGILNLAAASGADLATTSDIVTDALTAMGYSAGEAGRLADVMAAASSNANTNVEMMGQTFQYAAPVAGALGYSMEDTAVAIGLMANAGIKADKAGSALRSVMSRLAAPTDESWKAMDKLGISITDSEGNMKPLMQTMDELRAAFAGLGEAESAEMAKKLAGQNAMSGLLAVVNASEADYNKLTEAIYNSSGAAQEMSDVMQDNLEGDMTKLGSNLEGVQIKMYEKFEPALRDGVKVLNKLVDGLYWINDNSEGIAAGIEVLAAAISGYIIASTAVTVATDGWMALTVAQKAAAAAQWALNVAQNASPIGAIVAVIAALVAGFIIMWNTSDEFREFWVKLWKKVTDAVSKGAEKVGKFFTETVPGIFKKFIKWIKKNWASILLMLINPFAGLFKYLYDNNTKFKEFVNNAIKHIKELPGKLWKQFLNTTKKVIEFDSKIRNKAVEIGKNFLNGIVSFIKKLPSKIQEKLINAIKKVIEFNIRIKDEAIKIGKNFIDSITGELKELPKKMSDIGMNLLKGLWNGIDDTTGWILDKIKGVGNKITDGVKDVFGIHSPSRVMKEQVGKFLIIGVAEGIIENKDKVTDAMKGITSEIDTNLNFDVKTAKRGVLQDAAGQSVYNTNTNTIIKEYTFKQYNTSPKPLNRLELYRQTRNQLKFAEGV